MYTETDKDSANGVPRWLDEKEVAAITGVSLSTLRKHRIASLGLPYYKLGRSVRYKLADIIKYMEGKRVETRR